VTATTRRPAPWAAIAGATIALALVILLWAGRGTLYTVDDLTWFMTSPGVDLDTLLAPHNGHLILIPRLIYHLDLEVFGADYLPIRVLTALAAAAAAALFFIWTSRRVGRPAALAGTALILTLGTSYVFLIAGDGIMLQLSLVFGIGALLAIERRDLAGDVAACALLCLGVLTYSVALPFVVAVVVALAVGRDRRRAWIPAIPAALYAAWWLSSLGDAGDSASQVDLANLLTAPAYAFQSLASVLGALTGLDLDLSGAAPVRPEFDTTESLAGGALAVAAIAAFVWRLRAGPVPRLVWGALALPVSLWLMGALTADAASPPDATRFVLPFAVVLMLLAAATAGRPPSRGWLAGLWVVAACGIAANLIVLRDGGDFRRDVDADQMRAELAAFDLADGTAVPTPDLSGISNTGAVIAFPFSGIPVEAPATAYLEAAERYGELGFTPDELRSEPEELRARADAALLAARATALDPVEGSPQGCGAAAGEFELPPDGVVLTADDPVPVAVRRFADATWAELGSLSPGEAAALRIPGDAAPDGWVVQVGGPARACGD
jgi:hypothetical protein